MELLHLLVEIQFTHLLLQEVLLLHLLRQLVELLVFILQAEQTTGFTPLHHQEHLHLTQT